MTKLIQLNTLCGANANAMARFLKDQNADILHFQEAASSPHGRSDFFDFLQLAEQATGISNIFFSPQLDMNFAGMKVYYGSAIFSKHEFKSTYREFTNQDYIEDFKPADDPQCNNKLFQHAVVTLPSGRNINLINYHGYNAKGTEKQGNDLTEKHCQRIAEYITGLQGPKILTGDFNLAPESKSLVPVNILLKNLCVENKIETTRNQLANSMTVVDYIWVSDDITVNRFEVLPDLVSDHLALLLEFEI
jgi:endonuclease/exonuclease/phosphatase family metal-dependent hydrolase